MVWFNKKKTALKQLDTAAQLHDILSDGISVGIDELMQYQNKASLINFSPKHQLHGKMSGNYLARSKGRGMEFDEVRHYQVGDDIRAIDWRVTARTGVTHTKLFREEVERPVLIATDLSQTMYFGSQLLLKSVQATHLAALLGWHAKSKGDRLGGIIFNEHKHLELKPRSRQQGVLHYLNSLCQLHQQPTTEENKQSSAVAFEHNCARLRQLAKPGALVYLITDGYQLNEDCIRHLSLISQHCELVVCLITDPLEHQLPSNMPRTTVAVTDGDTHQELQLGDDKAALNYQLFTSQLAQEKMALLSKAGARVLNVSAATPLEQQLKNEIAQWQR
jgi:uncharacterized protein (DUF58 family)